MQPNPSQVLIVSPKTSRDALKRWAANQCNYWSLLAITVNPLILLETALQTLCQIGTHSPLTCQSTLRINRTLCLLFIHSLSRVITQRFNEDLLRDRTSSRFCVEEPVQSRWVGPWVQRTGLSSQQLRVMTATVGRVIKAFVFLQRWDQVFKWSTSYGTGSVEFSTISYIVGRMTAPNSSHPVGRKRWTSWLLLWCDGSVKED